MNPRTFVLAMAPLVLFAVAAHLLGPPLVGWAALASALLALVTLITGLRDGIKMITLAATIIFGGLAALAFLGGSTGQGIVALYGSGLCALLIGLAMLISVVTVPFTTPYARAAVPKEVWSTPEFTAINGSLSLVWAGVVIGIGLSRLAYAVITTAYGDHVGTLLRVGLGWGVPTLLVIVGVKRTQKTATAGDHASAAAGRSGRAPQAPGRQP